MTKECRHKDGEMCWRCSPWGRDPRDPEWPAREVARALLEAFELPLQADTPDQPLAHKSENPERG